MIFSSKTQEAEIMDQMSQAVPDKGMACLVFRFDTGPATYALMNASSGQWHVSEFGYTNVGVAMIHAAAHAIVASGARSSDSYTEDFGRDCLPKMIDCRSTGQ